VKKSASQRVSERGKKRAVSMFDQIRQMTNRELRAAMESPLTLPLARAIMEEEMERRARDHQGDETEPWSDTTYQSKLDL